MNTLPYFIRNQPKKVKWVWSAGQNLDQIWYNGVKKQRKTGISMGFFDILHEIYIYKHKVVFIEIPESKLKAKLATNTTFEEN